MTDQNKTQEIAIQAEQPIQGALSTVGAFSNRDSFEDAQRMAKALSSSTLVPRDYQGNLGNSLIALEMAQRVNASPIAVMQNLHIIHGKPSWSSQFTIAALNSCGRFSPLRFEMVGEVGKDSFGCYAWAYDKVDNEKLIGPTVTIGMAKSEGWYNKNGSKWKTMPELMIRYRSAKFFGNLYAPDILMGMSTEDEMHDINGVPRKQARSTTQRNFDNAPTQSFNPGNIEPEPAPQEPIDITPEPEPDDEPGFDPKNL